MAGENIYKSKYFTAEEIDQRLLQGYYDDAVSKGFTGTFDDFKTLLAKIPLPQSTETVTSSDNQYAFNGSGNHAILSGLYLKVWENTIDLVIKKWGNGAESKHNIPAATSTKAGLMTAGDKVKLDKSVGAVSVTQDDKSAIITITNNSGTESTQTIKPVNIQGKAGLMIPEDKVKLNQFADTGSNTDLNTYTNEGVYILRNISNAPNNFPINTPEHSSLRLTVLRAYDGESLVITQVLNLNNHQGGEGNIYIRSQQNGAWKPWGKLQTNIEVGQVNTLDNLTDNGIYSGVLTDGTPTSYGSFYDTFVLIVINNYSVAGGTGTPHCISQLKYSLALGGGISITKRTSVGGTWNEWSEVGDKYELPEATATTLGGIKLGTMFKNQSGLQLNIGTGLARYYDRDKNVTKIVIAPADTQNIGGVKLGTAKYTDKEIEGHNDLIPVTLDSNDMMCFYAGAGLIGSSGILQFKLKGGLEVSSKDGLGVRLGSGFEFNTQGCVELVRRTTFDKYTEDFLPLSMREDTISSGEMGIGLDGNIFTEGTDGVLSLKGGIAPTKVTWGANSNMNNYTTAGVYDIYGERTNANDNLPITQAYNGASIAARLTVVASTLQPSNTEKCVTQFLQLSNRMGGEGNTYIRTYNENNNGLNGWTPWKKQQGMVESYINTITAGVTMTGSQTTGLNGMTENGMYSGIYTDDITLSAPTFVETFVLVVINDYAVSSQAGTPRRISQLKYATDTLTGQCTVKKRVGTGDDSISWGDWEDVDTRELIEKKGVISVVDNSENPVQSKAIAAAIAEGEKRALRRLFITAGAKYNDTGADIIQTTEWNEDVTHKAGHYYLNGIGDITETEMMYIYNAGRFTLSDTYRTSAFDPAIRTIMPARGGYTQSYIAISLNNSFYGCTKLEIIRFTLGVEEYALSVNDLTRTFSGLSKLRQVRQIISIGNIKSVEKVALAFAGCSSLKEVRLKNLKVSISISDSPFFSKASVLYMISNATPTDAITITLHPDAFARLADDADVVAALEAKNAELATSGGSISLVSA